MSDDEYCPFQEGCKYAKRYPNHLSPSTEDILFKDFNKSGVVLYKCKAVKDIPLQGSECSHLNNLNRILQIFYDMNGINQSSA
jgi:hypothetical protein